MRACACACVYVVRVFSWQITTLSSRLSAHTLQPLSVARAGIAVGARTGVASIVTGSLFLLSLLFVWPFVQVIPDSATVPALLMVGVYSLKAVLSIDWEDFPTAFACFIGIVTMPF